MVHKFSKISWLGTAAYIAYFGLAAIMQSYVLGEAENWDTEHTGDRNRKSMV